MSSSLLPALADATGSIPEVLSPHPVFTHITLLETLHTSPGRVRLRMRGLRFEDGTAHELEAALGSSPEVISASASPVTGNLLIAFTPALEAEAVRALVGEALAGRLGAQAKESSQKHSQRQSNVSRILTWAEDLLSPAKPVSTLASTDLETLQPEPWHNLSAEQTLLTLHAQRSGLTVREVEIRLSQTGLNRLPEPQPRSGWALLWDQVRSVPVLLLMASATISFLTGGVIDGLVIGAVVVTNAAIGFATEKHAERTIATLTATAAPNALVLRAGRVLKVDATLITVGDIIPLSPGAYLPADARLLESRHLTVAESALTGESAPVTKGLDTLPLSTALAERRNMVYRGTVVTGGSGIAVVTAIGSRTEIGRIHALMNEASRPETPMERQLDILGRHTALGAIAVCGLTLVLGGVRGLGLVGALQAAVSLAVAALPEGLPSMATTSLASGMLRMRRENVLARSLGAVEAVGSIDVLCLDKTGTLTMNRMSAIEVYAAGESLLPETLKRRMSPADREESSHLELLLAVCALCSEAAPASTASDGIGPRFESSATEVALLELTQNNLVDVRSIRRRFPLLETQPRAEGRNFMYTVHAAQNSRRFVAMKGSPDQVLAQCRRRASGSGVRALAKGDRSSILAENKRLASKGRRVLAMAYCEIHADEAVPSYEFTWLGLVGLADPPRAEAAEAIRALHAAGITTCMITGDQGATAFAIGQEIGLFAENENVGIWDASEEDAPSLVEACAQGCRIFCRVTPSQKLDIVRALGAQGHVVAMTGDGINDGPALKAANVGIAMGGQSTETARESADLVLRDDDLRGLLVAIREGRTIHGNIRQAVHFLVATNFSEVLTVLGAIVVGFGQPISPRQLLWLNLVTDILPVLALAVEPPRAGALDGAPPRSDEPLIHPTQLPVLATESALIAGAVGASYLYALRRHGSAGASTMAFVTLSSAQLLHTLLSRSTSDRHGLDKAIGIDRADRASLTKNYVPLAVAGSFGLQMLTMFTPLGSLLGLTPLSLVDIGVCLSSVAASSLATFLLRFWTKRRLPRNEDQLLLRAGNVSCAESVYASQPSRNTLFLPAPTEA